MLIDVNFSDIKTMTASAEKPSPKKKGGEMKTKVVNVFYVNMLDTFFLIKILSLVARVFWKKTLCLCSRSVTFLFLSFTAPSLFFRGFEDKEKTKFSLKKFSRITHIT